MALSLLALAVANGHYFGGGMRFAPMANLDDRLLDVTTLSSISLPRLIYAISRIYQGKHLTLPEIAASQVRKVHLRSDAPLFLMLDGEFQPLSAPWVEFGPLPQALLVLT